MYIISNKNEKGNSFMEETLEIYDQYYDNYQEGFNWDSYYDYLAEQEDYDWSDNCE